MTKRITITTAFLFIALLLITSSAAAQGDGAVIVETEVNCSVVTFRGDVTGGSSPYFFTWDFGLGGDLLVEEVESASFTKVYDYSAPGTYSWSLEVTDGSGLIGTASGDVVVGPLVTLSTVPFPPLVTLESGRAVIEFTATATDGLEPYSYEWDLNGDGVPEPVADPASNMASYTYMEGGKYQAKVAVTDSCDLIGEDTVTVVIIDPEEEAACHPMARRIANAVNSIFPDGRASDLYTCEEIFNFFEGGLTGSQLGFGRMWHAYKLTMVVPDLTWETILDWHLDGTGWGLLNQLSKFAEALQDVPFEDLVAGVMSGEYSVKDVRTALRAVTRFEADFEDALAMLEGGTSPGKLGQYYRLLSETGAEAEILDEYLTLGLSFAEIKHAFKLADQMELDWETVLSVHAEGASWGDIRKAEKLAEDGEDIWIILDMGIDAYRDLKRMERQEERIADQGERIVAQLVKRYGAEEWLVWDKYHGDCDGDWSCVRAYFREQVQSENENGKGKGKNK
ncbi:MAG: PKD domain-containing protein [Anaerolineales bacterium]|nr:PKD domain-containing protein [Anaerolineales bacterium]